jgi:twitching motility protein PilJ
MAFKFPRLFFPLGGGARKVDPDTAIAEELSPSTRFDTLMVNTSFGESTQFHAERPAAGASAGAARGFAIPVVGRLPLRKQLSVLFPVLGLSLLMAILFSWLDSSQSSNTTAQAQLVGDSLMHSQRLAKAAPNALRGNAEAFRQLAESREQMSAGVTALQSGGQVAQRDVSPVEVSLQPSVQRLAELWGRTDQAADTLLQQRAQLVTMAGMARQVDESAPRLTDLSEQVLAAKVNGAAPVAEVAAAGQLVVLAQRMARNVGLLTAGQAVNPEVAFALGKDATAFREVSDGLLTGNDARRLAPAREGEARQRLAELRTAFGEFQKPVTSILADLPRLQGAKVAEQRIAGDSEGLRLALGEIQSGLGSGQAGHRLNQGIVAFFLLIAVLSGIALGLVFYQDVHRRAADADQQRAEAERLEQEAKRTNDQNQGAILRLMNELQEVADGDLTVQATVSEDITGAIADSVNYTVEELRNLVSRINSTAELVTEASSKAQTISSSLQVASEQQSREIRETGEAVLRMADQINEVSGSAAESANVARQSLAAAEQGRRAVQNAIAGMNGIRDQIQETSKRIKRLGESSQEIGEIVELISDITEQTNVLALNAAIQAASAGEAGRGFTVVAEEVQRLAERSAEATKQISALIRTIQADTQDAVAAMERSTQGVVAGTRLSDDAGNALGDIGRVSHQLAELIQAISRTTSEQASSAGTVAHSIQRILLVTEQTSEGTQQTAGSIQQLSELARELKNSVSRFRVS